MGIIGGIADKSYTFMVFRCRTDECYAADVNVFDGVGVSDIRFGDGLFKGIEVDGDEVNVIPTEVDELLMVFVSRASEQSAMDGRMEGLDSSTKDFWRLGVIRNFGDSESAVTQKFGCPA